MAGTRVTDPSPPIARGATAPMSPPAGGDAGVAETRRPQGLERWVLAALVVVAAVLRFSTLDLQSYWFDEAVTVVDVLEPSLWETLRMVVEMDVTPPLYFFVAWFWTQLFGDGEVGLRSLSALFGVATVPVAYALGARLASRRAGLILAAFVAVSPLMFFYAQESRAYAMAVFFSGLSLWLWVRVLDERTGRVAALWAVACALTLLTHYFAWFLVGFQCAWLLVATRGQRQVILAVGALTALVAALLPILRRQMSLGGTDWVEHLAPLPQRVREVPERFLTGPADILGTRFVAVAAVALVVAAVLLGWALVRGARTSPPLDRRERRGVALAAAAGAAALGIPLGLAVVGQDYFLYRYVVVAWLPFAAVVAVVLASRRAGGAGALLAALAVAGLLALTVASLLDRDFHREDWRALSEAMGRPAEDRAIAIGDWFEREPLLAYGHRLQPLEREGAAVREIVVVGKPYLWARGWRPGVYAGREGPRFEPPPPGFRLVEQRQIQHLTLLRYRADTPQRTKPGDLWETNRIPPEAVGVEPAAR